MECSGTSLQPGFCPVAYSDWSSIARDKEIISTSRYAIRSKLHRLLEISPGPDGKRPRRD